MRHTSKKQQMCVCVQLCYPCRSFSSRRSAVPLAGKAALHGLQPVSRPCTVRSLCRCVPQERVTHIGSATPGMACALDVVGTPLRLWGPAVHEHCPFVGCRWIWLSVSRPCTVRSLCRCVPQGRVTHMGSATPGSVARAPAIFSKQLELLPSRFH